MLTTSAMRFNAHLNMTKGPPHPFKDAVVVADSLTGIHTAMVKCLFTDNRSCTYKSFLVSPQVKIQDSNLASMVAMQWVLLCLKESWSNKDMNLGKYNFETPLLKFEDKKTVSQLLRNIPYFTESDSSLSCSQEPMPKCVMNPFQIHFNIILPSRPKSPPFKFFKYKFCMHLIFPNTTCPTHLVSLVWSP